MVKSAVYRRAYAVQDSIIHVGSVAGPRPPSRIGPCVSDSNLDSIPAPGTVGFSFFLYWTFCTQHQSGTAWRPVEISTETSFPRQLHVHKLRGLNFEYDISGAYILV
jgi:hypothetical protein